MIIELVGVPAAGKTTLANQLAQTVPGLMLGKVHSRDLRTKTVSKARAVAKYMIPIGIGLRALLTDSRPTREKLVALRWLISTFEAFASDGEKENILLPEGPIQRSLLLFYDAATAAWNQRLLTRYLNRAPRSDIVIFLDIDADRAERQLRSRLASGREPPTRFETSSVGLEQQLGTISEVFRTTVAGLATERRGVVWVRTVEEGLSAALDHISGVDSSGDHSG